MLGIMAVLGVGLLGVAVGWATGLSTTEGTTKRAITVLGGLAGSGGIIGWTRGEREIGLLIASLAIGFLVGLHGGIYLRGGPWTVYAPPPEDSAESSNLADSRDDQGKS